MKPIISIIVMAALIVGCSTTTSQLISRTENMQSWQVAAQINTVFQRYKNEIESDEGGLLLGGGIRSSGFFYDDSAELTLKMEGMQTISCLHIIMEKTDKGTAVKEWHYSDHWKEVANRLKGLLPVI